MQLGSRRRHQGKGRLLVQVIEQFGLIEGNITDRVCIVGLIVFPRHSPVLSQDFRSLTFRIKYITLSTGGVLSLRSCFSCLI